MQVPELVTDLGFGAPGDLPADARAGRAEAQAHCADVPVLGGVPVDRVLALAAALALDLRHGRSLLHWLPVWLPGRANQEFIMAPTWCAWQDSNPRPAA